MDFFTIWVNYYHIYCLYIINNTGLGLYSVIEYFLIHCTSILMLKEKIILELDVLFAICILYNYFNIT